MPSDVNACRVSGIVVRKWMYAGDIFLRLAVYAGKPSRAALLSRALEGVPEETFRKVLAVLDVEDVDAREEASYVVLRFPDGETLEGETVDVQEGDRVYVQGVVKTTPTALRVAEVLRRADVWGQLPQGVRDGLNGAVYRTVETFVYPTSITLVSRK